MASEKTPALYMEKVALDYDHDKEKFCSKSTASWIFAAFLIALLVVMSIQFLVPMVEKRVVHENVKIIQEEPIMVKMVPPVITDYASEERETVSESIPEFLIDPFRLCATHNPPDSDRYRRDPEVKMLIMVLSPIDHFRQREAIRKTWGSLAENASGAIRLGFVVGATTSRVQAGLLRGESSAHGDIVQVSFDDGSEKQARKSVLMLQWVASRCPHAQFLLKADDDTFVNAGVVANILGREPFVSEDKFIGGYIQRGVQPSRVPNELYFLTEDEYPDEELPPYATGSAYVMTGPTAVELFEATKDVQPLLPMEDIYITGLCGKEIDATLLHEPRFSPEDPPNPPSWNAFSSLATAHKVTPEILQEVWDDMTQDVLNFYKRGADSAVNATVALRKTSLFRK